MQSDQEDQNNSSRKKDIWLIDIYNAVHVFFKSPGGDDTNREQ